MATFNDLKYDWSMLCQECTECWTQSDLQLAAELGKTLLERNKELENSLKHHQTTIEEQAQEIEYMKKQTAALREVNDSRLRVYEQLEVSIQDLERANHRLAIDNTSDKKHIKSQCLTIETLEARCEDLQKKFEELNAQHEALLRRQYATNSTNTAPAKSSTWKAMATRECSIEQSAVPPASPNPEPATSADTSLRDLASTLANDEEVTDLLRQLHEARSQRAREQRRVAELGEQLNSILQENATLEEQINAWRHKAQDMKNLQDEISTLEEVRQGHLCGRCLRGVDSRTHDELSIMLDQEEDDDLSMIESLANDSHRESETLVQDTSCKTGTEDEVDDNPYRVLVQKYEALLEVQRNPAVRRKASVPTACLSLQEELEMSGDFNNTHSDPDNHQDNKAINGNETQSKVVRKPFSATPTDFSEAETSSSGFSDETSNKGTQTEGRPGYFLCSIADGEDCKFSIYDDASPIESRFRKTPEYRQLFREIFSVLKRAAEAKEEGEKLPLLDDTTSATLPRVPPVTPAQEYVASEMTDDAQSVMSSVISSAVSEPPYRTKSPVRSDEPTEPATPVGGVCGKPSSIGTTTKTSDVVLRPLHTPRRQPLEYLSIGVNVRKKSSAKKNSAKKVFNNDRPVTPDIVPTINPKMTQAKSNSSGRRKFRPFTGIENTEANGTVWNGNTLNFFPSKSRESPNSSGRRSNNSYTRYVSEHPNTSCEYRPGAASEEVARLRRLEMSYAEALRLPNKPKTNNRRH